jgi:creatinine amidohydrolase
MRTVRFEYLRPAEILAERDRCPVLYQPVGPLEWHGPHLPLGTDPLHAEALALRTAEQIGGVVMPTLFWGSEREIKPEALRNIGFEGDEWIIGMDFPGNSMKGLYSPEDIFGLVVRARLDLLAHRGYKLIVILNGHGAPNHKNTIERLAAEFTANSPTKVVSVMVYPPNNTVGHADAVETSSIMAIYPDTVDLSTLPALPEPLRNVDWSIVDNETFGGRPTPDHTLRPASDPRQNATPENGARYVQECLDWVAEQVKSALAG